MSINECVEKTGAVYYFFLTYNKSANSAFPLPPKCNNCTLEEITVLGLIQQDPSVKQTFIAKEIKKSERTVKTITARLTEKGTIKRSKGKGSDWIIICD